MRIPFFDSFTRLVGIDIGTSRIRIWTDKDGFVVDEACCLAVDNRTQKIIAVGDEAQSMKGRAIDYIRIYEPVKDGYLASPETATALFKVLLQRVLKNSYLLRPVIMVSVPASSTVGVRQAVVEMLHASGAREVFTIAQPLAAAIGAGVPIADSSGSFIFHLGSGIAEGALISLGSLVAFESTQYAGAYTDQQLVNTLKKNSELLISMETAQKLKHQVASLSGSAKFELLATGKDVTSGSPKEVKMTSQMLVDPLVALVDRYEQLLKKLLSKIPPELTVDVIDKGMLLSGGFAQLNSLDFYLVSKLGVSASVVEEPDKAVIKGIATALEHLDLFKESLGYRE